MPPCFFAYNPANILATEFNPTPCNLSTIKVLKIEIYSFSEIVKTTFNHDNQFIKTAGLVELQEEIENYSFEFLKYHKCKLSTSTS